MTYKIKTDSSELLTIGNCNNALMIAKELRNTYCYESIEIYKKNLDKFGDNAEKLVAVLRSNYFNNFLLD